MSICPTDVLCFKYCFIYTGADPMREKKENVRGIETRNQDMTTGITGAVCSHDLDSHIMQHSLI